MGCATSQSQDFRKRSEDGAKTIGKYSAKDSHSFGSAGVSNGSRAGAEGTGGAVGSDAAAGPGTDRDKALEALRQDGMLLEHMQEFKSDQEAVLTAVRQNGYAMEFAASELKADRDFVARAVHRNGWALRFAADSLKSDKQLALVAIEQTASVMSFFDEGYPAEFEFIREAVRVNGLALLFAGNYRGSAAIVKEATLQNPFALIFAAKELREDYEFMFDCVTANGRTLQYASRRQRNDRELVLQAVISDSTAMSFASSELKHDRAFIIEALRHNGEALSHLPEALRQDREVVLDAVRQNGAAIRGASAELRADRELVLEAVKNNPAAVFFADDALRQDVDFCLEALKFNRKALGFLPEELRSRPELLAFLRSGAAGGIDSGVGGNHPNATHRYRRSSSLLSDARSARGSLPDSTATYPSESGRRPKRLTLKSLVDADRRASGQIPVEDSSTLSNVTVQQTITPVPSIRAGGLGTRSFSANFSNGRGSEGRDVFLHKSGSNLSGGFSRQLEDINSNHTPNHRRPYGQRGMSGSMSTATASASTVVNSRSNRGSVPSTPH